MKKSKKILTDTLVDQKDIDPVNIDKMIRVLGPTPVLENFSPSQIYKLCQLNKSWRKTCHKLSNDIWKYLYKKNYGYAMPNDIDNPQNYFFKSPNFSEIVHEINRKLDPIKPITSLEISHDYDGLTITATGKNQIIIEFLIDENFPGMDPYSDLSLRGLFDGMKSLENLTFRSRFGSDGPWDYPLHGVKLPNLLTLTVDFITGVKSSFLKERPDLYYPEIKEFILNNPSLQELTLLNYSRDSYFHFIGYRNNFYPLPDNIKKITIDQLTSGLTPEEFLHIFGSNSTNQKRKLEIWDRDLEEDDIDMYDEILNSYFEIIE